MKKNVSELLCRPLGLFAMPLLLFLLISTTTFATTELRPHQLTVAEKRADLNQLVNTIKSEYGPREYKRQRYGLDADQLATRYWPQMQNAANNGEFYSLVLQFVNEFKDAHFRATIPTTLSASLPFDVELVQGKVLIDRIDRERLSEEDFPFERGDELLSVDNKPVRQIIDEFLPYFPQCNPRSQEARVAQLITWRPGAIMPVPSGNTTLIIKSRGTSNIETIQLEWQHTGESFDENTVTPASVMKSLLTDSTRNQPANFTDLSMFDIINDYDHPIERSYRCSGTTRITIPEDATILMEEPFVAYYHPTARGNVGYLRIPHYYPLDDNHDGRQDYREWLEYYRWALTRLEENTVGLIIDQDHNCGGSVDFLEEVVALFMTTDFEGLKFQFRASKRNLLELKDWIDEFDRPYYLERDGVEELYDLLVETVNAGQYLTPSVSFRGSQLISARGVYTKPIVMLIDYYSGSGGDAFPAMMQGLGRARLLGTTTGGLGGHVTAMEPLTYSRINYRLTRSLFFRPDGTPVENNGAVPDIPYEITEEDFINGYSNYQAFYVNEILRLIP